jgi:hypothetical protein
VRTGHGGGGSEAQSRGGDLTGANQRRWPHRPSSYSSFGGQILRLERRPSSPGAGPELCLPKLPAVANGRSGRSSSGGPPHLQARPSLPLLPSAPLYLSACRSSGLGGVLAVASESTTATTEDDGAERLGHARSRQRPTRQGMKEAGSSHRNEGDGRSRGFGVRPPGSRCRRKNVKSSLEEPFAVTCAGGV